MTKNKAAPKKLPSRVVLADRLACLQNRVWRAASLVDALKEGLYDQKLADPMATAEGIVDYLEGIHLDMDVATVLDPAMGQS